MSENKEHTHLNNIKTATLMILGLFILLRYIKSPYVEPYMMELSLVFMFLVLGLFVLRIYLEVKNNLFVAKKYYLFAFFIVATTIYGLYNWFKN